MLRITVHDWDNAKAGLLLNNLRRAMPAGAKLLLVEYVLPEGEGASFGKLLDLHMMVVTGGLEWTEAEHRQLFAAHGFRLTQVVPTASDLSVIEGVPAWKREGCAMNRDVESPNAEDVYCATRNSALAVFQEVVS